jgi:hypothetical protein
MTVADKVTLKDFFEGGSRITASVLIMGGYPHVAFRFTTAEHRETVEEWLKENLTYPLIGWHLGKSHIWFNSQEDATMFQLRWT